MQESVKSEPIMHWQFKCRKDRQKILIDIILKYSKLDIAGIAGIIEVSMNTLQEVYKGNAYLDDPINKSLAQLFLLCFSE